MGRGALQEVVAPGFFWAQSKTRYARLGLSAIVNEQAKVLRTAKGQA